MRGGRRLFHRTRSRIPSGTAGMLLFLSLLLALIWPGLVRLAEALMPLTRPAPGVLCDRAGGRCADAHGVSEALTALYLGPRAALQVRAGLRAGVTGEVWQAASGLTCDSRRQQCWTDPGRRVPDAAAMAQLFGTTVPAS